MDSVSLQVSKSSPFVHVQYYYQEPIKHKECVTSNKFDSTVFTRGRDGYSKYGSLTACLILLTALYGMSRPS